MISSKNAIRILLWMIAIITLFHLSILAKIIPYELTWGGRLENDQEMYVFEILSVLINLFFAFILLIKGGYVRSYISMKVVNAFLWVFLILFVLNTVGNVFAKTLIEKSFAILTLLFSYLIWLILRYKEAE